MLTNLGEVAQEQDDPDRASSLHRESLALFAELGDKWGMAIAKDNLGLAAEAHCDADRAVALFEQGLALRREMGDRQGIAQSLAHLARVAHRQGDGIARRAAERPSEQS